MPLTTKQQRFVELERKKDEIKRFYEDFEKALSELVEEQGIGSLFQDEQGTVYKLERCAGRYVKFDEYSYSRTKRPGEERGSLSMKEAREKGFNVD